MKRRRDVLIQGAVEQGLPAQLSPMLLVSQKEPFTREGWTYEPKLDGMRAVAIIAQGKCKLLSRSGRDITLIFPSIAADLADHKGQLIIDGEIVAHTAQGGVDFEALQARWMLSNSREIQTAEHKAPTAIYAFDVVHANGHDLSRCRLVDRKMLLFDRLEQSNYIKIVSTFDDGIALFNACKEQQLEGIVAKRQTSFYRSGERSKDWIKIKFTHTEQFVVVGHRKDEGFLLAKDTAQGLHIAGIVQYGFTNANYQLLVSKLKPKEFKNETSTVWFEPTVWVNVEFMQWTSRRQLRFPIFRGLVDR
jgi:ATP-dependent DNA ligase